MLLLRVYIGKKLDWNWSNWDSNHTLFMSNAAPVPDAAGRTEIMLSKLGSTE